MPERDVTLYIVDVLIAIDKVKRYTAKFDNASDFSQSELEWDATVRELQLIGDATNAILKHGIIDNSYRRIVDFRNQLVHAYFGIDEDIVWEVIQEKISEFYNDLLQAVSKNSIDLKRAIESAIAENQHNKQVVDFLKNIQ